MSKNIAFVLMGLSLFLFSCRTVEAVESPLAAASLAGPLSSEEAPAPEEAGEGNDTGSLAKRAEAATDEREAVDLYCEAARAGDGMSQFRLGQIFAGDVERKLLERKENRRQKVKEEPETIARRSIAAAMMWLDMAIINKVEEAKDLRSKLGLLAKPEDFNLYSDYTRLEADAPCLWVEIYEGQPPAVSHRPKADGVAPEEEFDDVKEDRNVE